ncbi:nicotinate phosphoribosyltransferase [Aphanomyces astaci]|uniref:Nicotinate phosphoribosyltransferase n=1 Tax=Aphanomyces astaci TaxID=112090 RepID=W4HCN0_APHAT|nr:nicotinate phosphoribosyltransferase [Aphanomyces astaci]ETV89667.1 nicotinate phosphoribosyltransferase [Aphanomyces astaci]|eukprot:XP_009822067.1 nicotinate phosphoribosyltransferase [Aphanomyces astaci]
MANHKTSNNSDARPTNSLVSPLLTDLYQITMAYAYWKVGRHEEQAVFDLFFRKNPFKGEFTVFAGLEEVLGYLNSFRFSDSDIAYLQSVLPATTEAGFFEWLRTLDCTQVKVHSLQEGTIAFPRIPVLRVEGHLGITQLLETGLLNLLNYASLMATNATRFIKAAGKGKTLLEFGLRRAQGPDGGISASRYSYMAGFHGTSNVLAGKLFGIPIKGTHAHAFVQAHRDLDDVKVPFIGKDNLKELTLAYRAKLGFLDTNDGELAGFISYAVAFPHTFLALVDTYDTLASGVPNFLCVALALNELGYKPVGIRLDSGDLAYLSKEARRMFVTTAEAFKLDAFKTLTIVASNDINEAVLNSLNEQGHEIDSYGIGTHLVTCQAQPALGMVYKLVQIAGQPRIKLSQEPSKVTIPGRKKAFRLKGANGSPILDLLMGCEEADPVPGVKMLCRHPFDEMVRVNVTPSAVVPLHSLVWDGENGGIVGDLPSLEDIRSYVKDQVATMREDIMRPLNATPYKVSVTKSLYDFTHVLWEKEFPVRDLH